MIGTKVAITTPKPQTTRTAIQGILTRPQGQIVFIDTPGIMHKKRDVLSKKLHSAVKDALLDIDVVLYVVDPTRDIGEEERAIMKVATSVNAKRILVINKIDDREKPFLDFYRDLADQFDAKVEVSALRGTHVGSLIETVFQFLPEGEPHYPEGQLTNVSNRFWLAELIREKLFLRLRQELPYTIHVEVQEPEERKNGMLYIQAEIFTTEERYKRMIIGQGGRGIKEIGQSVRKELEGSMGRRVFLDLTVEVDTHWMQRLL